MLGKNFDKFSLDFICNKILITLYLHLFATSFVKDKALRFINIINMNDLTLNSSASFDYQPEQEKEKKNNGISVIDSKKS